MRFVLKLWIAALLQAICPAMNAIDRIIGDPSPINEVDNTTVRQIFDKVSTLEFMKLRLSGTLTLASYTTAPTKLVEAVENLISQITLTAVGKGQQAVSDVLKSFDMSFARFQTKLLESTDVDRVDVGTTNAAFAFYTQAKLYFADPRSERPRLTMLEARNLASLILQVGFRSSAAMVTGGVAGTAVLSGTTVVTHAREYIGLPIARRPFLKETQAKFDVPASKLDNVLRDLPIGNLIRRMTFKGTVGANDYSDPSDAVFNNTTRAEGPHVRVEANGVYRPMDSIYQAIRGDNKELFALESIPAGYAVWEPSRSGRIAECFNARNAAKLNAIIDANFTAANTNTVQITTAELVSK